MRFDQLVCLARFHALPAEPALRELEEHDGLRFVHFEKDRRMNVDAEQGDARVVGRAVARIALLAKPPLPISVFMTDVNGLFRRLFPTDGTRATGD